MEPNRPAITPAQIIAVLIAGIPVVANLLHVFGVYDLSQEQQDALTSTMQWALGLAGGLALGDAYLRGKRNDAHASVAAATHYNAAVASSVVGDSLAVPEAEPPPLTDAELEHDPDMGDPPDAPQESFVADPKDKHGAEDHPA